MRNLKVISLLLLPLFGCFAQLENSSVTLSHNLCGGTTTCMPGSMPPGVMQVTGLNTFSVNFGDQPLLQPSTSVGPTTVTTSLILNDAAMQLQASTGNNFNNITGVSLWAAPTSSTDCTGGGCTLLADYDSARDGVADQRIVLRGHSVDLISYISASHTLDLQFTATGTSGPTNAWNADVSMDMGLIARANFP